MLVPRGFLLFDLGLGKRAVDVIGGVGRFSLIGVVVSRIGLLELSLTGVLV